jgi:hypothetical protein
MAPVTEERTAPRIFISYRRDDSSGSTGRLYDRLALDFPTDNLFIDVDAIAPGVDFVDEIARRVESCDVLLAVIGRGWQTAIDKQGRRRIDDPTDFVRIEIATALRGDVRVIPVLVDGATMPMADQLPSDLEPLVRRNAVELSHHRFAADVKRLARALAREPGVAAPPVARVAMYPPAISSLRLAGMSATLVVIIGSSAITGTYFSREGPEWWFERAQPAAQLWTVFAVMAGPGVAAKLWIPRLPMPQVWGIIGATFAGLVAMIVLQLALQALLPVYVPVHPQTAAENLLSMGLVEIPVMLGTGFVLGYFLAQAMRGWFADDGGPAFVRRMTVIWMVTGAAYAVATFLVISIGEAAALHVPGGEATAARLYMRMWADTVLFGMSWALGWILTIKFAGRRPLV